MTKLKISPDLSLPIEFVTSTQAIIAKKRVGKSYKAAVQAEELLEHGQQVVIIDPTSAHWGLRSSADGKSSGYSIVILGGAHGDLPLDPAAGEVIADAIIERGFSAILDLKDLTKGEEQRFAAAFLERLYRKNENPLHLFIDEADVYAPQRPFGVEEAKTLGACQSIVRRGGIKGIGCTMITQRAAVLNKDVLSQVDILTVLRMNHPKDIGAIDDWVAVHADPKQAKAMVDSLPSLPKGDAWVWAPEHDIFKRITFRDRRTFDSGATPKPGQTRREPRKLAPIELAQLGEAISAMAERHKADDPKHLRMRISELEKQISKAHQVINGKVAIAKTETTVVTKPAFDEKHLAKLEAVITKADDLNANWNHAIERARDSFESAIAKAQAHADRLALETGVVRDILKTARPSHASPQTGRQANPRQVPTALQTAAARAAGSERRSRDVTAGETALPVGEAAVLRALIQYPSGLRREQLTVITGYKRSTRDTYIQRLREKGFVDANLMTVFATDAGRAAMPNAEPLPTGEALQQWWLPRLPMGEGIVLEELIKRYPNSVARDDLTKSTGYKRSTRDTYLQRLSAKELVVDHGRGAVKASDTLFGVA